jgi:hypothetical protein
VTRVSVLAASLAACLACGGANGPSAPPATSGVDAPPASLRAAPAVVAVPDVTIDAPNVARVRGASSVTFDGIEEGLAWPSLDKALAPRKPGEVLTLEVARGVPTLQILRAAWTLRQAELHVQSLDATGTMRTVDLGPKPDAPVPGCHLAVFLRPDGTLRVAAPAGPIVIAGDDPAATLVRSLDAARAKCPLRYVAFGAESDGAPWGPVFDVLLAVDAGKSAGDARYVLGQAMHAAAQ